MSISATIFAEIFSMSTIRGEVTGRKPAAAKRTRAAPDITAIVREELARISAGPQVAFTIKEFCRAHRLSVSSYYELRKAGLGPREKRINTHIVITAEAAAEWRAGADNLTT
jgi:hypothetical protein